MVMAATVKRNYLPPKNVELIEHARPIQEQKEKQGS